MTAYTSPLVLSRSFAEIGPFCMLEFLGYTLRSCSGFTIARVPGSNVRVSGSSPDTQTLDQAPRSPRSCCHFITLTLQTWSEAQIREHR